MLESGGVNHTFQVTGVKKSCTEVNKSTVAKVPRNRQERRGVDDRNDPAFNATVALTLTEKMAALSSHSGNFLDAYGIQIL